MSDDLSIPSPTYRIPRRSRGMDPATRRLALIACGLGGTLLVVVGGWSLMGHRNSVVPVIQADNRPIRVKPENPGGMQVAGANEDIMSGGAETGSGKLAPPPEAPAPQALRAPPPPVPAQPLVAATPLPPAVAPAPAAAKPTVEKPAPATEQRVTAVTPERNAPAAKQALVQLAAVSSEEAAKLEWQRLEKRMGDLFSHHQPSFTKIERNGQTLWRLRTGGFSDVAQATAFCERVRAKGAGCAVAEF